MGVDAYWLTCFRVGVGGTASLVVVLGLFGGVTVGVDANIFYTTGRIMPGTGRHGIGEA